MKTWLCFLLTYVLFACASSACAQGALLYDDALLETPDAGPVCSYRVEYHAWDAQILASALLGEGYAFEREDAWPTPSTNTGPPWRKRRWISIWIRPIWGP